MKFNKFITQVQLLKNTGNFKYEAVTNTKFDKFSSHTTYKLWPTIQMHVRQLYMS